MQSVLSPIQSTGLADLFALFDSDRDGKLSAVDVASALRFLGLTAGFESDAEYPMGVQEFKALLAPKVASVESTESLSACFTSFDEIGAGTMPLADLRHALTTLGDPLSAVEAAGFTERCNAGSSGSVDMKRFLKVLS
jgi:calmodulin